MCPKSVSLENKTPLGHFFTQVFFKIRRKSESEEVCFNAIPAFRTQRNYALGRTALHHRKR